MYGSKYLMRGGEIYGMILIAGGYIGLYLSSDMGFYGMHMDDDEPKGLLTYMTVKVKTL